METDIVYEKVWESNQKGSPLYARLYNKTLKKSSIEKIQLEGKYIPKLYVETENSSPFVSFNHGKYLEPIHISSRKDLKMIVNENRKQREAAKTAGQEPPELYGDINVNYEFIRKNWKNTLECDHEFRTLWIDIETRSGGEEDGIPKQESFPKPELAEYTITTIQMYDSELKSFIILGLKNWECNYQSDLGGIKYIPYQTEKEMLNAFVMILKRLNPTVIAGFNSNMFDLPYLYNRMNNIGLNGNDLSPIGVVKDSKYDYKSKGQVPLMLKTQDGLEYQGIDIEGLYMMDYRDLVLKYAFLSIPSFSLQSVSEAYGIEGKHKRESFSYTDFDSSYTGKNIIINIKDRNEVPEDELELWDILQSGDKEAISKMITEEFMHYSIRDVEVMILIEQKAKLLNLVKSIAYITGVNVDDVSGTLKQWQNYVFNENYKQNVILSLHQQEGDAYGDYVRYRAGFTTSKPGLHKYVISLDFASLYPNIFIAGNMGADTIVKYKDLPDELKKYSMKDNSNYFSKYGSEKISQLYKGEDNDTQEEKTYFWNLLHDKELPVLLKKYNLLMSGNGVFYKRDKEASVAQAMKDNIGRRYDYKYSAIVKAGELEKIKMELKARGIKY